LVEQEDTIVLERPFEPAGLVGRPGSRKAGTTLEKNKIRQFFCLLPGRHDLTRKNGNLFAVRLGIIQRQLEFMIGEH
jgi:hypothetical protein